MTKSKGYLRTKFSVDVIKEAEGEFDRIHEIKKGTKVTFSLDVDLADENWSHDDEEEFFADSRKPIKSACYRKTLSDPSLNYPKFQIRYDTLWPGRESSTVRVEEEKRSDIERIFAVFEKHAQASKLPEPPEEPTEPPPRPKIFIGHGHDQAWKELKDHLHEKHEYLIQAYEIGARAGHTIRDILSEMMRKSSFALLVMTGEEKMQVGTMRARDNVIHEIGLFQGKLGWQKAIILLEEGTQEFSNIHGIQQIRFNTGNIKETFGDVLATLKREFPES